MVRPKRQGKTWKEEWKGNKVQQIKRKGPITLESLTSKRVEHRIDVFNVHLPNDMHHRTTPRRPIDSNLVLNANWSLGVPYDSHILLRGEGTTCWSSSGALTPSRALPWRGAESQESSEWRDPSTRLSDAVSSEVERAHNSVAPTIVKVKPKTFAALWSFLLVVSIVATKNDVHSYYDVHQHVCCTSY